MKYLVMALAICPIFSLELFAADIPAELAQAALQRRAEIRLGGDFQPDPKLPVFVAVGHGGRILLSRDDGQSWKQVFWGHAGSDHGPWATKAIAYTNGVFVVPMGWGGPTTWLASEDGVNWRHLTNGQTTLKGIKEANGDPTVMPGTWGIAGGKGVFVTGGYMQMAATPDLGKTITTFSLSEFKNDPRPRKLVTHHVGPVYCGDASGRFLALGNDRSKQNPVFGNLYASDDLGKTWTWLEPSLLNDKCDGYSGIAANGQLVVIADKSGANVFVSSDAGDTWDGPFATGVERATLSLVGQEFWLVGRTAARASGDGRSWRDLPRDIPTGKIVASPQGTLISIDRQRFNILRSTDGGTTWREVYAFQPETEHVHGAQGLRDIVFGYTTPEQIEPEKAREHDPTGQDLSFLSNGVTAHRGDSGAYPENTMPAIDSGIAVGADWIEVDIFRTRDGKLVVIHDATTERVGDRNFDVIGTSFDELLTVDVATDFRRRIGKSIDECPAQRIPLLEEVLRRVMEQDRTRVSIQPKMDCVEDAVALVKRLKAERWVGFNDGNLNWMSKVKRLAPEIPVFWDRGADTDIDEDIRIAKQRGFEALVLHHDGVTPEKVAKIKAAGQEVGAWTVNDRVMMEKLLNMGVERLYTDHPQRLLAFKADR